LEFESMAELATLARPYAEAFFQVVCRDDLTQACAQIGALAVVASHDQVHQFSNSPQSTAAQVFDLIEAVVGMPLSDALKNLLRVVIDNKRLNVLPEIAQQFRLLVSLQSGVFDAKVYSPFPIEPPALAELVNVLEKRFARRLSATVELAPELIGGVRVVVGDEVFDTSVQARLEEMRLALSA
jgi:F-type H+-transporting ATPase subunit delta